MGRLYWQDNTRTLYNASCTDMRELANESIQAVITSPPFWGLRKYAGEQSLIWGGDKDCEHRWGNEMLGRRKRTENDIKDLMSKEATKDASAFNSTGGNTCSLCGAWKGSLGLEPEPDCGRPYLKLKDNLTDKQREYVMSELERLGLSNER